MKLKRKLISKVIEDLESRGAKVIVMVEPLNEDLYEVNWIIDARWSTGRHWIINTIIEEK